MSKRNFSDLLGDLLLMRKKKRFPIFTLKAFLLSFHNTLKNNPQYWSDLPASILKKQIHPKVIAWPPPRARHFTIIDAASKALTSTPEHLRRHVGLRPGDSTLTRHGRFPTSGRQEAGELRCSNKKTALGIGSRAIGCEVEIMTSQLLKPLALVGFLEPGYK